MGRCSLTEVFDPVAKEILKLTTIKDRIKILILKALITALECQDWDCQQDSDYIDNALVQDAFEELADEN